MVIILTINPKADIHDATVFTATYHGYVAGLTDWTATVNLDWSATNTAAKFPQLSFSEATRNQYHLGGWFADLKESIQDHDMLRACSEEAGYSGGLGLV